MLTIGVSAGLSILTGVLSAKCLMITPRTKNVQTLGLFISLLSLSLALTTLIGLLVLV